MIKRTLQDIEKGTARGQTNLLILNDKVRRLSKTHADYWFARLRKRSYTDRDGGNQAWAERVSRIHLDRVSPARVMEWQKRRLKLAGNSPVAIASAKRTANSYVRCARSLFGKEVLKHLKGLQLPAPLPFDGVELFESPKLKLAFAPYAQNDRQQSRWGGMDFDAHQEGQADRAQQLAFAAFRCLLNEPELCIILERSGSGGYHVWAIAVEFWDTADWIRLLKRVAAMIGAPIASGVCEIFPPDSLPSKFGKGMRAPGCWNPGTDTHSEIYWENTHTSLESVLSGKSKKTPLVCNELQTHFLDKERSNSFSSPLYHWEQWGKQFGITQPATRNSQLATLVGEIFHQVGAVMARRIAQAQFQNKTIATNASEREHLANFEQLWAGMNHRWQIILSEGERGAFAQLETDNERDAFRIIRSYAAKAMQDGAVDFPIVRDDLAARLGVTGKGAAGIRDKLAALGVIVQTAKYVPNKFAARFKWLLECTPPRSPANDPSSLQSSCAASAKAN